MTAGAPAASRLRDRYDVLLLDLDGTVYAGADAIPGARDALVVDGGPRLFYVTNNASRSPADVAGHLNVLGFPATEFEVVTSSQSAARLLAQQIPAGSAVLVVGTDALAHEVELVGLNPVRSYDDAPVAVVQGHSPDTGWRILAEATLAIRAGAYWVASNVDSTLPTERGLCLGNGSMVAALRTATGRAPDVAGKPARPLMDDAVRRSGAERPLVIGDRIDTDIAGANDAGLDSLLVLSGVSTPADLLVAAPSDRPTYLAHTLAALEKAPEALRIAPHRDVSAQVDGATLWIEAGDDVDESVVLRAALAAAWEANGIADVRGRGPVASAVADRLSGPRD
ncbi:HAD-IIA family hydrolase [Rhodococcus gannanensis]|uniref:HAD-IIA family hydrolase n=1 Tax=Rhodococcus gannanensis TaxID=1960308 RepID=A0ABW4P714_9NOCA